METELKPCPFCGGEGQVEEINDDIYFYYVLCQECFSRGPETRMEKSAILLWNGATK